MELDERVEKLEKQIKGYRLLLGAAFALAVPLALLGAKAEPKETVLKTPVRIVDPQGDPVLEIGTGEEGNALYLFGAKGKGLVTLSAAGDGTGLTISKDLKGEDPDVVMMSLPEGNALLMNAPKGKKGVEIATAATGGEITAYDAQGNPRKR